MFGAQAKKIQFGDDHLTHVIQQKMKDAESLVGYLMWDIWHALRLRHGIHVSRQNVSRIMKEIDPLGYRGERGKTSNQIICRCERHNACWHLDGNGN